MIMVEYAKRELERIGKDEDGLQEHMNRNILEIIEKFSEQGHSGFSAGYALSVLERLLRFKPISPLTGEDDEWNDTRNGSTPGMVRPQIDFQRFRDLLGTQAQGGCIA